MFYYLQTLENRTTWMSEQQQEMIDKMRAAINEKDKTIEVNCHIVGDAMLRHVHIGEFLKRAIFMHLKRYVLAINFIHIGDFSSCYSTKNRYIFLLEWVQHPFGFKRFFSCFKNCMENHQSE